MHIFDYEGASKALVDWESFSSADQEARECFWLDASVMVQDDPPKHTAHRRIFNEFFRQTLHKGFFDAIAAHSEKILRSYEGNEFEACSQYAERIAIRAVRELLGYDDDFDYELTCWLHRLSDAAGNEFFCEELDKRRNQKQRIAEVHQDGIALFNRVIDSVAVGREHTALQLFRKREVPNHLQVAYLKVLSYGSFHTLSKLISNITYCLSNDFRITSIDNSLPIDEKNFIEEVLRYRGPTRATVRRARRDARLAGAHIRAGDAVIIWLASANRDEAVFANAAVFDPSRTSNRHLAFALGVHLCAGKAMARGVGTAILSDLMSRRMTQQLQLVSAKPVIHDPWVDGFEQLRIRL